MSYRCQECNDVHHGPAHKVVREYRDTTYNHYSTSKYKGEEKRTFQFKTNGLEIVKELFLCVFCASRPIEPKVVNSRNIDCTLKLKMPKTVQTIEQQFKLGEDNGDN
jgi:hypothetical protein